MVRVFGPARDDDLKARRDHVEPFRDVLAELDPKPVAAGAALVGEIDDDLLARQMFGQRAAIDLALAPNGRPGWLALAFRLGLRLGHKGHHHFIDMGLVAEVEGQKVRLSANAAVAVTMEEEGPSKPS